MYIQHMQAYLGLFDNDPEFSAFTLGLPNLHHSHEGAAREITCYKQQGVPSRAEAKPPQEETPPADFFLKFISFFFYTSHESQ